MCSPHNLSSNLSWVQASYAEATVPEEIYFLAFFLHIIARTTNNKNKEIFDRVFKEISSLNYGAVTNVSDQWVCINISGDKLYELLSMSCPFNFSKFKETKGSTTQTIINHIDVIIHNLGDNNINLFVRRSFSNHLWDWLNDGANLL